MCVGVSVWLGWSCNRAAGWSFSLMSLAILFHFLCAQHVSDINIHIIKSLRLFCWITTLVVLFLVRCVLEFRCGWVGVVSELQAEASAWCHLLFYFTSYKLNMFRTLIYPSSGACDQCGNSTEYSQTPDDGNIKGQNMSGTVIYSYVAVCMFCAVRCVIVICWYFCISLPTNATG